MKEKCDKYKTVNSRKRFEVYEELNWFYQPYERLIISLIFLFD